MVKKVFIILLSVIILSILAIFSINIVSAHSNNSTECQEEWVCIGWNNCRYGEKERECVDVNHCGTTEDKPDEIKSCYSRYDYYDMYYTHDYMMRDCSPRALYSPNHYCSRYFRDRQAYLDNYELELANYYQSLNQNQKPEQPQQPQTIQVQLTYPESDDEDERYEERKYDLKYSFSNPWIMGTVILAVLSFILLIIILIALVVKRR